jgi:hypothetical protein
MYARGINYFLIADTNNGSEDFAKDPESWGLKLIGQAGGDRLYRTIP